MCDAGVTLTRESICVTCLSQDRKLFPINDSKSHALFLDSGSSHCLCEQGLAGWSVSGQVMDQTFMASEHITHDVELLKPPESRQTSPLAWPAKAGPSFLSVS
ncbi:hypothetical protein MSG28_015879 [Choristoneura fumiferana]|uniref:Uncharacterized protein n=1 Tax=Choristoneura fumiferana TaxID=7141 RepID=A0ACC0K4L6_CHOFU|nr:hypothetical protein MSG28_015879 [Choristoneura fumiferana]